MSPRAGPIAPGSTTSFAGAGGVSLGDAVGSGVALGSCDGVAVVSSAVGGSSDPQPERTRSAMTAAVSVRLMARSCRTAETRGVGTER
jgi:hypothetical protein